LLGNFPMSAPRMPNLAAKELAFFQYIGGKYRFQRIGENFPFYFLHLSTDPVPLTIEHSFHFKPLFHWILVNRAAPPFGLSLNCLITPYLTRCLTPSLTRSLTQLLTRWFIRSNSFITHFHEEKREIRSERVREIEREGERGIEYTYLIRQSPGAAAERIRFDIFNYFSTLDKITSQSSAVSLNQQITRSLTRILTPLLTRSLTQLLTRSFNSSTSFITHLHEEKREIREREGERGIEYTYRIRQSPGAAAERIRSDIFNYFSTLDKITSQSSAVSINHLIIRSLTRTLTPSLTRPLTQLLNRSFIRSTSFITRLHEEKRERESERFITRLHEEKRETESEGLREIREREGERGIEYTYLIRQSPDAAAERIRADIFNYFSTLDKITSQSSAVSINHLITRSLTRTLTPSLTRPLTQLLTRSFIRSTSFITRLHEEKRERERFITHLHEEKGEIKSERLKEIRESEGERGIEYTYLSQQSPGAAAEHIRSDIFNFFSTFNKITRQLSAASINRLITSSLIRPLTPSLTQSFTRLLTHSFTPSTAFITHLHVGAAAGDETRDRKLDMEKPAPRAEDEAVKEKTPLPELPGFERARLELRYTSAFYLAGRQDALVPHTHSQGGTLSIPPKKWLSSGVLTTNIDLGSLAGENDSNRPPMIKHAPSAENHLFEERIKKIEQTITTHTKQFETRMKDTITTSASSFAAGVSSVLPPDLNLSSLTDHVYHLLMERVKRERRMMGY